MNEEAVEVVRLYNEAWLNRDLVAMERYLADDLVLWHNHIRQEFDKPTMMKFVGDALHVLAKVEFRNPRRMGTERGCIQQHEIYCEMFDGGIVDNAPQAIVYSVANGRINRIEEYIDGPALAATGIS